MPYINDLFAISESVKKEIIPGLSYYKDFLTIPEANHIVSCIDASQWNTDMSRRVQHYGFKYDYQSRHIDNTMRVAHLPEWANLIGLRLFEKGLFPIIPDQVIINEYLPGQGITPHIDCVTCFTNVIASVSLLSSCLMNFRSIKKNQVNTMDLEPNSLVVFADEARYDWQHGIVGRKNDRVNGHNRLRQRRISITFRKVILNNDQ